MSADTAAFVRPAEGGTAEPEGGQCAEASMVQAILLFATSWVPERCLGKEKPLSGFRVGVSQTFSPQPRSRGSQRGK